MPRTTPSGAGAGIRASLAARAAAARQIKIAEILHSEKLRAKETAEILTRFLSPARGVREISGLSPEDDPLSAKAELELDWKIVPVENALRRATDWFRTNGYA